MDLIEKTKSSEHIFEGRVVDLWIDTVELPDGNESKREIIKHPGGVCVFAVDDENNVFMVRQFRKPTEQVVLEIPAGKLEYGEDPLKAGIRELEEEVGVVADEIISLGYIYPTPAYCCEKIHMFFARNLKQSSQHLDEDEFLEVLKTPYDELYSMVINNKIIDGKTALATLRAKEYIYPSKR